MELKRYKDFLNEGLMDPKPGPKPEKYKPFIYNPSLKPGDEDYVYLDSSVISTLSILERYKDIKHYQVIPYHIRSGFNTHEYNKELVDSIKQKYKSNWKNYKHVPEDGYSNQSVTVTSRGDKAIFYFKEDSLLYVEVKKGDYVYIIRPVDSKLYPDLKGIPGAIKYNIL